MHYLAGITELRRITIQQNERTQGVYATPERAAQAVGLATPAIEAVLATAHSYPFVYVVVLGPLGEILHEGSVGTGMADHESHLQRVIGIARSKALLHYREGMPSALVQARRPHLLLVGDTVHGGSAEHEGLIAAASGIQGHFDEAIAGIIASVFWGLCKHAQEEFMKSTGGSDHYRTVVQ